MDTGPELLTVAEAAQRAGTSPQAIRERIRRGTLPAERGHRAGRIVQLVRASALGKVGDKVAQGRQGPLARGEGPSRLPGNLELAEAELLRLELAQAQAEASQLREELARARSDLAVSAKVEEYAQRAADKLETKLETVRSELDAKLESARREALSLARALGRAEAERDQIRLVGERTPPAPSRLPAGTQGIRIAFAVFFIGCGGWLLWMPLEAIERSIEVGDPSWLDLPLVLVAGGLALTVAGIQVLLAAWTSAGDVYSSTPQRSWWRRLLRRS